MTNYQNGAINVPDYHGTTQRQWVEGALVGSAIGLLLWTLFHGDRRTVGGKIKLFFGWVIVLIGIAWASAMAYWAYITPID